MAQMKRFRGNDGKWAWKMAEESTVATQPVIAEKPIIKSNKPLRK